MNQNKIELNQLAFYAYHGVTEEEARLGQRFYLDVKLDLSGGLDFSDDAVGSTVNYAEVYEVVKGSFQGARYNLIERAAEVVADAVLQHFNKVEVVGVKVKKPSVPVDCICHDFAVEVIRCR